ASFVASTFPERHPDAELCVRSGAIALRRIADFFEVKYDPNPKRGDPISVSREEYEEMHARVARAGVDLRPATEETWLDFAGGRRSRRGVGAGAEPGGERQDGRHRPSRRIRGAP